MNLELNVVRFENEDVIATSNECNSVYGIAYHDSYTSYIIVNNKSGAETIDLTTHVKLPSDAVESETYVFHVDKNGNFVGYCPCFENGISLESYNAALEAHNAKNVPGI